MLQPLVRPARNFSFDFKRHAVVFLDKFMLHRERTGMGFHGRERGGGMKALHPYEIRGVTLSAHDDCASLAARRVAGESSDDIYGLETIAFEPENIVIDVGAHVGLVSLYLAKRWPFLRIFAFEPHASCAPDSFLWKGCASHAAKKYDQCASEPLKRPA
jgi:hypothetical protein